MNHKRVIAILALLVLAVSAQAQSGRRQNKPQPAAPIPTPTPEPTPAPKKEQKPAELIILVGKDIHSAPSGVPLSFHSAVQRGCAERLRSKSSAEVDAPERDMMRGEAIQKAKESTNTYVVLLSLRIDEMASTRSYNDLQLDFVVFAPATAKVLITGRSYINSTRTGPVILGPTSRVPSGVFREEWLRQAGEDAADRILKKVNQNPPPAPK